MIFTSDCPTVETTDTDIFIKSAKLQNQRAAITYKSRIRFYYSDISYNDRV